VGFNRKKRRERKVFLLSARPLRRRRDYTLTYILPRLAQFATVAGLGGYTNNLSGKAIISRKVAKAQRKKLSALATLREV
jgi:hypothetical protein